MSWAHKIRDAFFGTSQGSAVTPDGAVRVTLMRRHAGDETVEQLTRTRVYVDQLENAGSVSLAVDGSVTPVEFDVPPSQNDIVLVRELRFVFHGSQMNMDSNEARRFGPAAGLSGLTNGLEILVVQSGAETPLTTTPIQHMGEFFTYASQDPYNVVDGIAAGTDLLVWVIDFKQLIPIPISDTGLDRVLVRVNDDLTSLTFFEVIAIGEREASER